MRKITFDFDIEILWAVTNTEYNHYVRRRGDDYFNIFKVEDKLHIEMAEETMIKAWGYRDISTEKFLEIFGEDKEEWNEKWLKSLEEA